MQEKKPKCFGKEFAKCSACYNECKLSKECHDKSEEEYYAKKEAEW